MSCSAGPPQTQRLGQGGDSLNHYAGNRPELPEGGDTGKMGDGPTHRDKDI